MNGAARTELAGARPPVIIIGAHRSGTTATARALRLLGLQIGHVVDSHDEARAMQRMHEKYLREIGAAWHNPGPFLESITTAHGLASCVKYLRQHIGTDLSLFGYGGGIANWWLRRRLRSGVGWGWKEPRTTLFARCWLEIFPQARILHVVRNPIAVARSIQKRELEFQAKGDAPSGRVQDFDYCVGLAVTYAETGEAVAGAAQQYSRVRFEDLQSNPAGQLRKLAAFCELRFTDRMMQRAAATIRPTRPDALEEIRAKQGLLARHPLAATFGYGNE